jgi:hypothetical protein
MEGDDRGCETREETIDRASVSDGRRRAILLAGSTLFALAGCTDDGDNEEPASGQASMVVRDVTVSETTLTTEETLEITGVIDNEGDGDGTFHAELRMNDVIVETEAVAVAAGESETVAFSGSFYEPGEYDIRINDEHAGTVRVELPPPEFELVDAAVNETTVAVGEEIELEATIANVGGREGTFTSRLQIDGRTVETQERTIAPDETESVLLTTEHNERGRYELGLNGTTVDTVTVERPAEFEIDATGISETTVFVGEEIEVAARIENIGEQAGDVTTILEADGEPVATQEGEIAPGETATARFVVSFDEPGAHPLSVAIVGPVGSQTESTESESLETIYVRVCENVVSETTSVSSSSSQIYGFELEEHEEIAITVATESGVEPTLSVVSPTETLVDGESSETIDQSVETVETGRYEVRLENEAFLPWREGRWTIELELCQW